MKNDPKEVTIGNLSVRTFEAPPEGFDPLTASKTTLMRHGIVPKPDEEKEPELYKAWHKVFSRDLNHIVPEFEENKHKQHKPSEKVKQLQDGTATSHNWSGEVIFNPAGDSFKWIEGSWIVPDPNQPPGLPTGSWYYSSAWVGIDGYGSPDVLQAGTSQDALVQNNSTQKSVYAWWEWYPNYEIKINNLPVSSGDYMTCLICVTSNKTATIYLTNLSTSTSLSFQITAPSGTTLVGNSAEWIVEAPTVGGNQAQLVDYGATFFDSAIASTQKNVVINAGTGTNINMINNANKVISTSLVEAPQVLKMSYTV